MPSSPQSVMTPSLGKSPSLDELEAWRVHHQRAADAKAGRKSPELAKPEQKKDLLAAAVKVRAAARKLAGKATAAKAATTATPATATPDDEDDPVDEELWRHMEKKMANSNQSASNNIIVMTRTRPFNKRETDLKTFNCLEVRAEEESNRKLRLLRSELLH